MRTEIFGKVIEYTNEADLQRQIANIRAEQQANYNKIFKNRLQKHVEAVQEVPTEKVESPKTEEVVTEVKTENTDTKVEGLPEGATEEGKSEVPTTDVEAEVIVEGTQSDENTDESKEETTEDSPKVDQPVVTQIAQVTPNKNKQNKNRR